MEKSVEERVLSLERQFTALLRCLDKDMHDRMFEEKLVMRKEDGKQYKVQFLIETDKGTKSITIDDVWAWSDKDAIFVASVLHIQPNMDRLQAEGKIRFYKIINKKIW
jgi:hypothetical protein